jgi:hypothetical protein
VTRWLTSRAGADRNDGHSKGSGWPGRSRQRAGPMGEASWPTSPHDCKRSRVKPRKNCRNLQKGEKTGRRFHEISFRTSRLPVNSSRSAHRDRKAELGAPPERLPMTALSGLLDTGQTVPGSPGTPRLAHFDVERRPSQRNPKSAPGFSQCRGSTECRVPHRAGFDAPLKAQQGAANPARTWGTRYQARRLRQWHSNCYMDP